MFNPERKCNNAYKLLILTYEKLRKTTFYEKITHPHFRITFAAIELILRPIYEV